MIYESDKIYKNKYEKAYFKPISHKYYLRIKEHNNHCAIKNSTKLILAIPTDTIYLTLLIAGSAGRTVGNILQFFV